MNNVSGYLLYKTLIDNILTDFGINPVYCIETKTTNEYVPTEYTSKITCKAGVSIYLNDHSYDFPPKKFYPSYITIVLDDIHTTIVFHQNILYVEYLYNLLERLKEEFL